MIIVITTMERIKNTGVMRRIVSHGIDDRTGKIVILPCEPPEVLGARFDAKIGEYVLEDAAK